MDMTPEQKQRIEEEEQRKLAEEQYRAQVRARLQGSDAPSPAPEPDKAEEGRTWRYYLWIPVVFGLGLVIVFALIGVFSRLVPRHDSDSSKSPSASTGSQPSIRYVPVSQKVATGQVVVKARGYVQYSIHISPDMRDARVSGSFNVSGGSGNDIAAVVADENEFINWINGHQAKAYYGTRGNLTTDRFDVRLGPGNYVLAFSNRFSALSDKYVFLDVDLNYSRLETY
jgi:hypothetical protein